MIKLLKQGVYKLIKTKQSLKVLYLDDEAYALPKLQGGGEITTTLRRSHKTDCILSVGHYNIYRMLDNVLQTNVIRLELEAGEGVWQAYKLPAGLPTSRKPSSRIIPLCDSITPEFSDSHAIALR